MLERVTLSVQCRCCALDIVCLLLHGHCDFQQMLAAWHKAGFWLGDVKPSNLVLDTRSPLEPQLYAIDFEAVVMSLLVSSAAPLPLSAPVSSLLHRATCSSLLSHVLCRQTCVPVRQTWALVVVVRRGG